MREIRDNIEAKIAGVIQSFSENFTENAVNEGGIPSFFGASLASKLASITTEESDYNEFAKRFLSAIFDDGRIERLPNNKISKELERQFMHYSETNLLSEEAARIITSHGTSDPHCWDYAANWASSYIEAEMKMPAPLKAFAICILGGAARPKIIGVHTDRPVLRDIFVKLVAELMLSKFNLPLEANAASGGPSIGKAIAQALSFHGENVAESAIRKIVRRPWQDFELGGASVGNCLSHLFPTP